MVIWTFYQCPSLPCPLLLDLAGTGRMFGERADESVELQPTPIPSPGSTSFLSPAQCAWLELNRASEDSENSLTV